MTAFALVDEINLDHVSNECLRLYIHMSIILSRRFLQKSVPEHLEFKN